MSAELANAPLIRHERPGSSKRAFAIDAEAFAEAFRAARLKATIPAYGTRPITERLTHKMLELTGTFEGFVSHPYNDGAGNATIGFGHLLHLGPVTRADVAHWGTLSRRDALVLLRRDMADAAAHVRRAVHVHLTRGQFWALVDFTFNCGPGSLDSSTLLRELNEGNYRAASKQFKLWIHDSAGNVEPGLVKRRKAETHAFREGL